MTETAPFGKSRSGVASWYSAGKERSLKMEISAISQLSRLSSLFGDGQSAVSEATGEKALPFQSLFEEAIGNVKDTDAALQEEIYKLATGQTDNVHDVTIASTQASLSVDLLIQLRNSALEAYNQIMNISL
mgnify:CR=1 FL=1